MDPSLLESFYALRNSLVHPDQGSSLDQAELVKQLERALVVLVKNNTFKGHEALDQISQAMTDLERHKNTMQVCLEKLQAKVESATMIETGRYSDMITQCNQYLSKLPSEEYCLLQQDKMALHYKITPIRIQTLKDMCEQLDGEVNEHALLTYLSSHDLSHVPETAIHSYKVAVSMKLNRYMIQFPLSGQCFYLAPSRSEWHQLKMCVGKDETSLPWVHFLLTGQLMSKARFSLTAFDLECFFAKLAQDKKEVIVEGLQSLIHVSQTEKLVQAIVDYLCDEKEGKKRSESLFQHPHFDHFLTFFIGLSAEMRVEEKKMIAKALINSVTFVQNRDHLNLLCALLPSFVVNHQSWEIDQSLAKAIFSESRFRSDALVRWVKDESEANMYICNGDGMSLMATMIENLQPLELLDFAEPHHTKPIDPKCNFQHPKAGIEVQTGTLTQIYFPAALKLLAHVVGGKPPYPLTIQTTFTMMLLQLKVVIEHQKLDFFEYPFSKLVLDDLIRIFVDKNAGLLRVNDTNDAYRQRLAQAYKRKNNGQSLSPQQTNALGVKHNFSLIGSMTLLYEILRSRKKIEDDPLVELFSHGLLKKMLVSPDMNFTPNNSKALSRDNLYVLAQLVVYSHKLYMIHRAEVSSLLRNLKGTNSEEKKLLLEVKCGLIKSSGILLLRKTMNLLIMDLCQGTLCVQSSVWTIIFNVMISKSLSYLRMVIKHLLLSLVAPISSGQFVSESICKTIFL